MSQLIYTAASSILLANELEAVLSRHLHQRQKIVSLERRPSAYRSSCALEELAIKLDDGRTFQLMFKDLHPDALLMQARRSRPDFVQNPLREIETYRTILTPSELETATLYGASVDPARERYWLFIEYVKGSELYQIGDRAIWHHVARWLANLHSSFGARAAALAPQAHLLIYDAEFYRKWIRRAECFLGSSSSPAERAGIKWLARRYDRVVERLLTLPVTFIHGEFYASNILVQERCGFPGRPPRICPVDWEMAALGPGLVDLAALTAGNWTDAERTALALAYYDSLCESYDALPAGYRWYSQRSDFLAALELCQLHLAMQWLGWFGRRRAYAAHSRNWLGDALRLAKQLGL